MIEKWTKVWVVDMGSVIETPRVRKGFVSGVFSNTRYIVTHDDGTEGIYMAGEVFLTCRLAHNYQVKVLGKRLSYLRPRISQMENTLTQMIA